MLKRIVCKQVSDFASCLAAAEGSAREGNIPLFQLYTGEKGANGKSWCPDCVVADPIITESLTTNCSAGAVLLECPVERNEYRQVCV